MNLKHLVILILLILIVFLAVSIHNMNQREEFQYNHVQRENRVQRCSEAISQLVNIVESLKAVNLPPEIVQEIAMTIITEDPQNQAKVYRIISDLDISDSEKQELNNIALNYKGVVTSIQDKHAIVSYDQIHNNIDKYQNDLLFYLDKNN